MTEDFLLKPQSEVTAQSTRCAVGSANTSVRPSGTARRRGNEACRKATQLGRAPCSSDNRGLVIFVGYTLWNERSKAPPLWER